MSNNNVGNVRFNQMLSQRRAGVVLHPTSLPGPGNLGDFGLDAYRFIDFLSESGLSIWQVLPMGPVHEDLSPYMGLSMYAGNPELISLEMLIDWQWLTQDELKQLEGKGVKRQCLSRIGEKFFESGNAIRIQEYQSFCERNSNWLNNYAMFESLKNQFEDSAWSQWPEEIRQRDVKALEEVGNKFKKQIQQASFLQFVFYKQWNQLKAYANERNIIVLGDMPIFVAHDSADVWQNQHYFDLKSDGSPRIVAGVPPDYFSETGQRWGNPLYRWDILAQDKYQWWIDRFRFALDNYDSIRVDHFRGFEAYWEIDANEDTAMNGQWVNGPGDALFNTVINELNELPVVVEDLGTITDAVTNLRDHFGWPGMKILQFAFDGNSENPYLPHKHVPNCVVYTGTHDNDTTLSWYEDLPQEIRENVEKYLGESGEPMPWTMIETVLRSVCNWAIVPMQDLLSLGKGNRMNVPGVTEGNWQWRFNWEQVPEQLPSKIKNMIVQFERDVDV